MVRERLKTKRMSLNLTQSHVAEAAGIDRTYYVNIENGKRDGSVKVWLKILSVLNIPETQLGEYLKANEQKGA